MKRLLFALTPLLPALLLPGYTLADTPRLSDIVNDPATAKPFAALIAHQHLPSWVKQGGVESPMQQVTLNGEPYQVYSACQPHHCGQQKFALLYSPRHQHMSGLWLRSDEDGKRETLQWLKISDDLSIDGKTVLYAALTGSLENHPAAFNYQP